MKILFLSEYFYPFAHGGSERSILNLAKSLIQKGDKVYLITANLGTRAQEVWDNINITRVPMFVKINLKKAKAVSPIFFYNFLTQFLFFFYTLYLVLKQNINLIHVQGSFLLLPAYLAAKVSGRKIIYTMRDYQLLCPLGLCINKNRRYKTCNLYYFLTQEVGEYLSLYMNDKSSFYKLLLAIFIVRSRVRIIYYKHILSKVKYIVCISNKQKRILSHNGINNTSVIYNTHEGNLFPKNDKKYILYAGRLTPGKGVDLLLEAMVEIYKNTKTKLPLIIAGNGILKSSLKETINKYKLSKNVILLGSLSYEALQNKIRSASLVVVPSRWEEPFGRVALEAQMNGIPTVVTASGGLPEIVLNNKTGYIAKPSSYALQEAILKAIRNNTKLRKNLTSLKNYYTHKFQITPVKKYQQLYNNI